MRERQDTYLLRLINDRNDETSFMGHLFRVISQFAPERRLRFIKQFVQNNTSFEAFRHLPLEPGSSSWIGSQIPLLHGRVEYWESLRLIMNTVDLLLHKQYIERYIQDLQAYIEQEKKRDFIGD